MIGGTNVFCPLSTTLNLPMLPSSFQLRGSSAHDFDPLHRRRRGQDGRPAPPLGLSCAVLSHTTISNVAHAWHRSREIHDLMARLQEDRSRVNLSLSSTFIMSCALLIRSILRQTHHRRRKITRICSYSSCPQYRRHKDGPRFFHLGLPSSS